MDGCMSHTKRYLFIIFSMLLLMQVPLSFADSSHHNDPLPLERFIGTLKLIDAEYADAVAGGKIIDEGEYLETEIFLEKAQEQYTELAASGALTSVETEILISSHLDAIQIAVSEKKDPSVVSESVQAILSELVELSSEELVLEDAKGEIDQQQIADAELAGEQVVNDLRIGFIIENAEEFWIKNETELVLQSTENKTHHLEIVLRDYSTKRMIPYAQITLTVENEDGSWKETKQLEPVWAEFIHYGNNYNLPSDGKYIAKVQINHEDLAHHEGDMWVVPTATQFAFSVKDGRGEAAKQETIQPVKEGYTVGDDLAIAATELNDEKQIDQYLIGFISETAEEIYIQQDATLSATKTDAQTHHLEIVLRDAKTGRMIPYADISMVLKNRELGTELNYDLLPLWGEFFHYATNAELSEGTWDIQAVITPSQIGYHDLNDMFSEQKQITTEFVLYVNSTEEKDSSSVAIDEINVRLTEAVEIYRNGKHEEASTHARDIFILFEEQLGKPIGSKDPALENKIESGILKVSSLMIAGAPLEQIESEIREINEALNDARDLLNEDKSPFVAFFQSLTIIVREGFEAILIIGAIIAYLRVTQNENKLHIVYFGVFLAILASLLTAWLLDRVLQVGYASKEIIEGITMLIAVVVLFYVGYWILSKVEAEKWQNFIKGKVQNALTTGNSYLLGSVAFLAVYREGFETVLFYKALVIGTPGGLSSIFFGIFAGLVLLAILFGLFYRYGVKIPMKPFFIGTSMILYVMSFTFAGKGIAELQAGGVLPITVLSWAPEFPVLGMHATVETFIAQLLFFFAFVFLVIFLFARTQVPTNKERS